MYLTNTPSFYKVNLCEALGRSGVRLLLVLYGFDPDAVNIDLSHGSKYRFDYIFLHHNQCQSRNKLVVFYRLLRLMRRLKTRKILYAGWLSPEYIIYSFLSPKKCNAVVCESRMQDVALRGFKGILKRIFIARMSAALPAGIPHRRLFEKVKFSGLIRCTGSVGIINHPTRKNESSQPSRPLRFLYVGRLASVKNLSFLIRVFNDTGLPLTIVGGGEEEAMLKAIAGPEIHFMGYVENEELSEVYAAHDVLILPSAYEPWGLVVEEALCHGLPAIVSDKVGCGPDLIAVTGCGEIFIHDDTKSLRDAIRKIEENYVEYRSRVAALDFKQREDCQLAAYKEILQR